MDEFPTEEEEFELMYADELEVLNEQNIEKTPKRSRKSLDFGTAPPESVSDVSFTPLPEKDSVHSNKRTVQELFGDIDDLLNENRPKKPKTDAGDDLNADYALIDHIVELRKLNKKGYATAVQFHRKNVFFDRDKHNISSTVPNYPFVVVKRHDGQRVYVRCHSDQYEAEERQRIVQEVTLSESLGEKWRQTWQQALLLLERQQSTESQDISTQVDSGSDLWVELYKPRRYIELLSDESVNRVMLRWVKLWDKVVFNRRPKVKVAKPKDKPHFKVLELNTNLDEDGRPYHKVALLCGPPGLGKTTLAHMVAKHAGYNVVEVNASDDRSVEAFKNVLQNATQMRSVLDEERRPNCLVFDEIDGAPASSIDYLVKYISAAGVKGKKKQKHVLRRPIICICNDVYVPALRPLRQIAFVVNFPSTSSTRLAERLLEIARKQKIKTDLGTMLALAEKSHNDVRSCLSVLHMFKSMGRSVTLSDVHRVAQKDMQKGLFDVWQDIFIFQKPRTGPEDGKKDITLSERMDKVLSVVNSFGDYDKVAQGVFENYPSIKYKNSCLESTCEALDWFTFNDLINRKVASSQCYELNSYLQYAFVVWHFCFSTRFWQRLHYPNAGFEARTKANRQKAILRELMKGVQPNIRPYVQPVILTLDILPLLSTIIVPPFRPINLQLYTDKEKRYLNNVVAIMIDYNLNYVQERTVDGTYVYKMDPNIEEVVKFGPKKTLSYSNRQLIAKEIEVVKMHRFEAPRCQSGPPPPPSSPKSSVAKPSAIDFLRRTVIKKPSPSGLELPMRRNDIWYQYKEGYSNAVKKKIRMSDL